MADTQDGDVAASVTIWCAKRAKRKHQCSGRCAGRVFRTAEALAVELVNTGRDQMLKEQLVGMAPKVLAVISSSIGSHEVAESASFQVGETFWSISPRHRIEGSQFGGSIEVEARVPLWDAFYAAGRVVSKLREARYFGVGQFQVESAGVILYGEYVLSSKAIEPPAGQGTV